jgi:hypothetical protein
MNKMIISLCTVCMMFVLCACEKAMKLDEETGQGDGNLTVSVWQIEQTPFSAFTRTTIAEACTRLNFMIYASDGTRVKYVNQTSGTTGFGAATFQLEPATYQVVVVGHSSNGNPTSTDLKKIQFTNAKGYTDTFLYYGKVVVTEDHQTVEVSLNRITSLCRFTITDDYPEDVAQMQFYYTGGSGAFDATTGLGSVNSKQDLKFDVTGGQKQFDLYTYLHDTEGTLKLKVTAYDDSDNVLYEREFDVPMKQTQITWLSGPFFSGSGADGSLDITVVINTDWKGETHITF